VRASISPHAVHADAVVVAYRSGAVIGACISALRADRSVDRIIVVNNSTGDDTSRHLEERDDVRVLESPRNLGFGAGVNAARGMLRSPYVVIANPDAHQTDDTVRKMLDFLEEYPKAAVVGPRMIHEDGSLYLSSQHDVALTRFVFSRVGWPASLGMTFSASAHDRPHLSESLVGSFLVCRVSALDSVGWFDSSIFMFGEETDLCRRLRRAGWEVWYVPNGRVVHLGGHSWRQTPGEAGQLLRAARYEQLRRARGALPAALYRLATKAGRP
jgi:N-acetylglucosaminyl-diphospho-decaprenol L-rhamnosyltransferase